MGYSILMIAGALIALAWANVAPESYTRAAEPLHFAVNDVAMAFFFGIAVKTIIEATAPGGALHSIRRGAMPVIAAVGGMAGPALLYVGMALAARRHDLLPGWAIPCATDIAFSFIVARAIFPSASPAIPFLLLLAIADDALGLILLATFYPSAPLQPWYALLLVLACACAWALRARGTSSFWPYILGPGTLSWLGLYLSGLHPALALVPVLPFVPHGARLDAFERTWSTPVEFILFFFALVNAGVPLTGAGTTTWIVLSALLVGKPVGIASATWLAERVGFRRPHGLTWTMLVPVGFAAGIGFTVALFFTTAAFAPGATQDEAKLGALLSVSASVLAIVAARVLGVDSRRQRRA